MPLVEVRPGQWETRRFDAANDDWRQYLAELAAFHRRRVRLPVQLLRNLRYRQDAIDEWAAPETIAQRGYGDCEDHLMVAACSLPEMPGLGWKDGALQAHVWPELGGFRLDFSGLKEIAAKRLHRATDYAREAAAEIAKAARHNVVPRDFEGWANLVLASVAPEAALALRVYRG